MASSSYDDIADMYQQLWSNTYLPAAMPALETLFFSRFKPRARVLDLCCGCGHVTAELVRRKFRVTGIDNSAALVALAKKSVPGADFRVADARTFRVKTPYEGILSTYDSLNHILSLRELEQVFTHARAALQSDGLFLFDMNLEQAYTLDLQQWMVNARENCVGLSRGLYDHLNHRAHTELIWFTRKPGKDSWRRAHSIVEERCYQKDEIMAALDSAGFREIQSAHGVDLGIEGDLGYGRYFFSAR